MGLTKDRHVKKHKGFLPEIKYRHRKEILESIKYVYKVIPSDFIITNSFIKKHKFDFIVHGSDFKENIDKKIIVFKRTKILAPLFEKT